MNTKRINNSVGIIFKYIPWTETKPNRYKVIQTNNKDSKYIKFPENCTPLEYFEDLLNSVDNIESYSLVIDNTQNEYYLFSVNIKYREIGNLIETFK